MQRIKRTFVGDPTQQALLKLGRTERGQDGVEAVMRRDSRTQIEKPGQPLLFLPAILCDGHKVVSPADRHDVDQRIGDLPPSRLGQVGEMILDAHGNGSPGIPCWPDSIRPLDICVQLPQ